MAVLRAVALVTAWSFECFRATTTPGATLRLRFIPVGLGSLNATD